MTQNLGSVYKRGRIWWVTYNVDGTQHRESSHGTRKGDANRLLAQRIAEISDGRFVTNHQSGKHKKALQQSSRFAVGVI